MVRSARFELRDSNSELLAQRLADAAQWTRLQSEVNAETKAAARDLSEIYEKTGEILNRLGGLFNNTYAELNIIGHDDFETVLQYITDVKCRQVKDYEKEFGEPAPFPRPRNCH